MRPNNLLSLAALLAALATGCSHESGVAAKNPKGASHADPVQVRAVLANLRTWPRTVRVQGSVFGDELAVVGAKVAGRVRSVKVDLGDQVEENESLAMLESEEFALRVAQTEAQLAQARAKLGLRPEDPDSKLNPERAPPVLQEKAVLEEARSNLARARSLEKRSAISIEEVQQRDAAVRVAEARLASALNAVEQQIAELGVFRAELALARQAQVEADVRAPFAGIISARHVAPGVYLQVGNPVVTLVRTNPLRFMAGVPERDAQLIKLGQTVKLRLDGVAEPIVGKIDRISPALDIASRSLAVEVDVPNPGFKFRAGLFADAEIIVDPQAQTLAVPAKAVREFAGVEKVWVIVDGKAQESRVQTGRKEGEYVEILDGLQADARVAVGGRLMQGRAVTVLNEAELQPQHAE